MCGISGIFSLNGKAIKNVENRIHLMNKTLHHRGPDQNGVYISEKKNFALGNNRLSIVSPNEKINLPFSKNQNEFLSFNGEIYNFLEIKNQLKKKNVNFITSTDTEVIYEFIKNLKIENLEKVNGMWAFAYYNEKKHELILSRDLMGERHLFYTINNNELIFCSEVQPILAASIDSIEMDFESMIASWKFNSSLPGKTLMKNIFRIKSGTNMSILNNKIEVNQFQKLHPEKWFDFFNSSPSIERVNEKFIEIFSKEIDLRIPRDIKYYITLSGGIDSSTIAYFLKKILKENVNSIYLISDVQKKLQKELQDVGFFSSQQLADKLALNHTTHDVTNDEMEKEIKFIVGNCFDGCIDQGTAKFGRLAAFAKKNSAKVMMMADGPDELLGGYDADVDANRIDKTLGPNTSLGFLKNLSRTDIGKNFLINFLNLKKNKEFEFRYEPFYTRVNHMVCPNTFLSSITDNFNFKEIEDYGTIDPIYNNIIPHMDFSQIRALNYASKTLPEMFNLRADKAFMRHSVEARFPFQSISLVEFFIAMKSNYRFKNNLGKFFLRNFVEKKVDKNIAKSPKRGMGSSLWDVSKNNKLLNAKEEILSTNFFDNYPFNKNIKKILLNSNVHPGNIWAATTLIKTFENYKYYKGLN